MPPAGIEPTISAGKRPQTYALDSAATDLQQLMLTVTRPAIRLSTVTEHVTGSTHFFSIPIIIAAAVCE